MLAAITFGGIVHAFADQAQFKAVAVLVLLDILLGIYASWKTDTFALTKLVAFLKDDVLSKVVPWFTVYSAWKWAPDVSILGIDLNDVQATLWAGVTLALLASLTASLSDLGVKVPAALGIGENQGAPPRPSG